MKESIFGRDRYEFIRLLRDILIQHLDGAKVEMDQGRGSRRRRAVMVLLERRLIVADDRARPTFTVITEKGRAELARLLADYADTLTKIKASGGKVGLSYVSNFEALRVLSLSWIAANRPSD